MSRPGIMPVSAAVLLTLAAGLSLAEEGTWPGAPAVTFAASRASDEFQSKGTKAAVRQRDAGVATERAIDAAGTGDGGQARSQAKSQVKSIGVGSRGMMGNDEPDGQDQPEMATGVDLNGPPVRFPAGDTPE